MGVKRFPAIFIKTKFQDKFQTILCYEGFIDSSKLLSLIRSVLLACESEIAQAAEISATRFLQNEQDAAYLRSLEIDKEKLRKKRSQCEGIAAEVEVSESSVEPLVSVDSSKCVSVDSNISVSPDISHTNPLFTTLQSNSLNKRISRAFLDIEDEPSFTSTSVYFKFQFSFPNGTRRIRTFNHESTTKALFDFIFSSDVELLNERIVIRSIEPSIELLEDDSIIPLKLKEIEGIGKGIKLFIEYL